MMTNSPDIFSFSAYRAYLQAWLKFARDNHTSNLTQLAKLIGVHSSYLGHVITGTKNLSFEQATELSEALNHTAAERDYLFALIQVERAGSEKLRKYWDAKKQEILSDREKMRSRVGGHSELTQEVRSIFYSSWIYVAVFVATAINDGQTLEQIANRFSLSREKAQEILEFLVGAGICNIDGSTFKMGIPVVYLPNESPLVIQHHTNWRVRAIEKIDTRKKADLFFTSPMSMSATDIAKAREILAKSIEQIHEICRVSPAEDIVCLNIDLFHLEKT